MFPQNNVGNLFLNWTPYMATGLNNDGVIFKSQRDLLNEIEIETDSPHAKVGSPLRRAA